MMIIIKIMKYIMIILAIINFTNIHLTTTYLNITITDLAYDKGRFPAGVARWGGSLAHALGLLTGSWEGRDGYAGLLWRLRVPSLALYTLWGRRGIPGAGG